MRRALASVCSLALCLAASATARADGSVIGRPGAHPGYVLDLEPHLLLGTDDGVGGDNGYWGPGVRGTLILVDNGFVKSINNSVGLGVGLDYLDYKHGSAFYVPVVMQWNFFLSSGWSVFGEPGIGFFLGDGGVRRRHDDRVLDPNLAIGGRYLFSDKLALTMRIGWPAASVGVSFLY
ncbi:MAG: hypothetical protein IT374_21420 [Polyangiaceae bacterium]|nr:hypothetical protein [Polyangiaceae bacterium]